VGFGSWAAGGPAWFMGMGPQDDADSLAAMRHAVACGVNWIDTAASYGHGHAEEVIGRLLRGLPARERPLVFTKCGNVWDDGDPLKPARRDLSPASIRAECDASLRRLGVERIDLLQFHWPATGSTPVEESWQTMLDLVAEGKVRAAGLSNFDAPLLERCEAVRHVDSLQPPFSLLKRAAGGDVIPWCAAHGTGVIVYSPMQVGILTDRFSMERVAALAPNDARRGFSDFQPPKLARNIALRDALRPVAARHDTTVAAVAVAWTLAWPGVTGAIVGARSPDQVDGWLPAATLQLTPDDLAEIAAGVEQTHAGVGPVRPA
jgi:aryl-alcohol dehydrogenase-like predicted oxidoreductase